MEYDISKLLSVGSLELELSLILQKTACGFIDWPLFYIVSFYADVTFYKKIILTELGTYILLF